MMNKLNYDYSLKKLQKGQQKQKQVINKHKQKESPPLKQWIVDNVECKHILQQKKAALLSKPNNKTDIKKLNNCKKKKVIKKKKTVINHEKDNNDDSLPIDIVLKFSESLELASRNLIRLTTKLKNTIDISGMLTTNNSYIKSNNTSISTPSKKSTNIDKADINTNSNDKADINTNLYGQKFNDEEEEELDYLVKTRLKKRLLEIITGQDFSITI